MISLDLTDFHINNLKSSKDLNISRWKRIGRWVSSIFQLFYTQKGENETLTDLQINLNKHMVQDSGSTERYTDFGLNVKLKFQTASGRAWVIPARVSRLSRDFSFVVQLVVKISLKHQQLTGITKC